MHREPSAGRGPASPSWSCAGAVGRAVRPGAPGTQDPGRGDWPRG